MTKRDAIYARFEAFEEQLAHCYFLLHERFINDPPLARFWVETAMEEMQHFSMLRFCRERGLTSDIDLDSETAGHVEELLGIVKGIAGDPEVSVDEAFYASLLIEASELEEVYEKLTATLARDHPLLYQAIHSSLRGHHAALVAGVEQFCGDTGFIQAFRNLSGSVL